MNRPHGGCGEKRDSSVNEFGLYLYYELHAGAIPEGFTERLCLPEATAVVSSKENTPDFPSELGQVKLSAVDRVCILHSTLGRGNCGAANAAIETPGWR